jgi:hypothetical protein
MASVTRAGAGTPAETGGMMTFAEMIEDLLEMGYEVRIKKWWEPDRYVVSITYNGDVKASAEGKNPIVAMSKVYDNAPSLD